MALPLAPFNTAKSIFAGKSVIQLKIAPSLSPVTAATTVVTFTAHGLSAGQLVVYVSGTGFTGLVAGTSYFVLYLTVNTFSLSATLGGSAIAVGTSSAGVFQPIVVFESRLLNSKPTQEVKKLQRPDAAGVLRTVRQVRTSSEETFTFEMDEGKRLLEIFSGALSGFVTATCTLWLPDPADAAGIVALKSENDFTCTVTGDGDTKFGDSDFTKPSVMITSTKAGAVSWTADGAA